MSSSDSPRKGFGAFLGRLFGSSPEATTPAQPAAPAKPMPKAPAPLAAPAPQVLVPRKGVGTVLRKAVQPGEAPHQEPDALWKGIEESEEPVRQAKPASKLLNLPRTVLSMLRKAPPPPKPIDMTKEEPTHDPAFTRRKERDYPII